MLLNPSYTHRKPSQSHNREQDVTSHSQGKQLLLGMKQGTRPMQVPWAPGHAGERLRHPPPRGTPSHPPRLTCPQVPSSCRNGGRRGELGAGHRPSGWSIHPGSSPSSNAGRVMPERSPLQHPAFAPGAVLAAVRPRGPSAASLPDAAIVGNAGCFK